MGQLKDLRKFNDEMELKLSEENKTIVTDVSVYFYIARLSEKMQEMVRQDIMEMALSAQERGESLETAIGKDYKEFCDEIIASLPKRTLKEKCIEFINFILRIVSVVLFYSTICISNFILTIRKYILGESTSFDISYRIGLLVLSVGIIGAIFFVVRRLSKKSFEISKEAANAVPSKAKDTFGCFLGVLIPIVMVAVGALFDFLFKYETITVNLFVVIFIIVTTFSLHKWISWKQ